MMEVLAYRIFPGGFYWPYATWYDENLNQLSIPAARLRFDYGQPLYFTLPTMGNDNLMQITWAPASGRNPTRDIQRPYVNLNELVFAKGAK